MTPPFASKSVADAFAALPDMARDKLLAIREAIFETAANTPGVGAIEETLKWGQPAYLTSATNSGSTIRLGATKSGDPAIYAHCQTTIIADFRPQFPTEFTYADTRAVILPDNIEGLSAPIRLLIASALTYHLRKRSRGAP